MHGTIQTLDAKHHFGFLRDAQGAKVFFRRSALTPPERFASLEVGMRVAFEPASGPTGLRTAQITVTPLESLRDGRLKRWPPTSAATPPANFLTGHPGPGEGS